MRKGNSKGNKKKNNHKIQENQSVSHLLGFIEEKEPVVAKAPPRRN